jgi:hypothetical protein
MQVLQKTTVYEATSISSTEAVFSDTRSAPRNTGLYERYLEMPVPVVLLSLWLAGAALLGLGILTLYYLLWLALESLAGL